MKKQITLYTDGACSGNPGPGGYAAILIYQDKRKEITGGFRRTTNNRMELMALIIGLESLKESCQVQVHADSKYVLDAINKGWLSKWRKNGWKTAAKKPVENVDLWQRLLPQLERHVLTFSWVEGHAGHEENERADVLAVEAYSDRAELPVDAVYEKLKG